MAALKNALFSKELVAAFIIGLFLLCTLISAAASLKYLFVKPSPADFAPPCSCDPPPLFHAPNQTK